MRNTCYRRVTPDIAKKMVSCRSLVRPRAVGMSLVYFALLSACTSGWKAPMESRGVGNRPSSPRNSEAQIQGPTYRVRSGDTLYAIAWRSGNDFRTLASWNGIASPYVIYPGQILRLSSSGSTRSYIPAATTTAREAVAIAPRNDSHDSLPQPSQPSPSSQPSPLTPTANASPAVADSELRWIWPVRGRVLDAYRAGDELHKGIKVAGSPGDAVRAAEAGRVVYSGSGLIGYGRLIIVKHNDNYLSAYGHNRKLLVAQDDQVTKGQQIAELGSANDGTPMLHFEIRRDGRPINPVALLPRR